MKKVLTFTVIITSSILCSAQYPGSKYHPIISGDDVTFHLTAKEASSVIVYGDFLPGVNEYNLGGHADLTKGEDGTWSYTAEDLDSDFYFYYFEVDGVKVLDPHNLKVVCNYSEFYNSFMIPGEGSSLMDYRSSSKGTLHTIWYDSPEYGGQRRMNIYLPADYSSEKRYPVLYMLPGGGDDEATWIDMGRLPQIMDNMLGDGKAEEMIVVMVNSMPNQLAAPHIMNPIPEKKSHFEMMGTPEGSSGGEFANDLIKNIIPYIEAHYSVIPEKSGRAICGVSMGGLYLTYIIHHNPDIFDYIGLMGSGIMGKNNGTEVLKPVKESGYKLIWIGAGENDMAFSSAKNIMETMDEMAMPYKYYNPQDGHNWRSWRRNLINMLPELFR